MRALSGLFSGHRAPAWMFFFFPPVSLSAKFLNALLWRMLTTVRGTFANVRGTPPPPHPFPSFHLISYRGAILACPLLNIWGKERGNSAFGDNCEIMWDGGKSGGLGWDQASGVHSDSGRDGRGTVPRKMH